MPRRLRALSDFFAAFGIFKRKDPVQQLNQGDLAAEALHDARQLDTHGPRTQDDHRFRDMIDLQQMITGNNPFSIGG